MVNIDTRLVDRLHASSVNEKELWLLIHVVKRINVKRLCWPSNELLLEDTGWHIEKLQSVKKSLVKKGLLQIIRRGDKSNVYKINTEFLGVFVRLDEDELQECKASDFSIDGKSDTHTTNGKTDRMTPGKTDKEVLTKEVLTNIQGTILFKDRVNRSEKIIDALNDLKKTYGINGQVRWTKERATMIEARIKEWKGEQPYKEICTMMEHRCKVWKGTEWQKFIRIETMFQPKKFVAYMEEAEAQPAKDWTETRSNNSETLNTPLGNISW
jgi:uncharacterized phage protein (TIGR02220 family)